MNHGQIASIFAFVAFGLATGGAACSSSSNGAGGDDGGSSSGSCSYCPSSGGGSGAGPQSDAPLVFGGSSGAVYNHTMCPAGKETTISGRVYDPAGINPLYNVTVYIPGTDLVPFSQGASCASCSSLYATPRASAVTDASGNFIMKTSATGIGVPDGPNMPLVVQVGKWRRKVTIANVTPCQDNPQADKSLRLPKNGSEGDLPQIAISTGAADSLECLLRRMGVDASEYVAGPGTGKSGHLHIFTGAGGVGGAAVSGGTSYDPGATLWDKQTDINPYDVVLFSCEGTETAHLTAAGQQVLLNYANAGGRVFASHFHYAWFNTGPFAAVTPPLATWTTGAAIDNTPISDKLVAMLGNGMPFPEGVALGKWLANVGALTNGELPIQYARDNAQVTAANTASQLWISADTNSNFPGYAQYFSFDTPPGQADKCGRVVYSDLHVSGGPMSGDPGSDYPSFNPGIVPDQCAAHPLTPQEKALEFMIFDLSSCLIPPGEDGMPPPVQ